MPSPVTDSAAQTRLRLDKWLWHARMCKTRSLASALVRTNGVRVNGVRVSKPSHVVGIDDVLTFALGARVKVLRVLALGTRRGPAPEAQSLYEDLSPPPPPPDLSRPQPVPGGRPDKAARRRFAAPRRDTLE